MKPTLIIMAAGMGSRFGGLKQITPVGPSDEKLMDYSVYDAVRAGFGKVVFVIKHAIEDEFKEKIGNAVAAHLPVEYVYQELDALPNGYTVPEGREKPWGTGHAVLCCRDVVKEPFAVINADDYYGRNCFALLADFLASHPTDDKMHFAMAGYRLRNTLTENGYVSRGVCEVDADNRLLTLTERTHIEIRDGEPQFTEDDGANWAKLPADCYVSMNCWAFPAGTLDTFEKLFCAFLDKHGGEMKSEFYLPAAVDALVEDGRADVQVLPTEDKWYGMTYAADHAMVRGAIASLTDDGVYPTPIWK
ncbi:MAG: nucleotidyltransferase [Clostridia bacterium]|nr:nucleotidyltransferase [Clostridia bacterium]